MALAICSLVRKIILAYQNFISINTRKPQKPILCADRSVTRSPFACGITAVDVPEDPPEDYQDEYCNDYRPVAHGKI